MAVVLASGGPTALVCALAVVSTVAGTPFRAAYSALLPSLRETPNQLTSANAVRGMLDSVSTVIGPLVAAVLLDIGTPAAVFGAAAPASFWSAALVLHLDYEAPPRSAEGDRLGLFADARVGLRALAARPDLALLIGLGVSQTFTRGALNVLAVVMAIDLLDIGEAGVGVLSAAVGAGAVIGSIGASLLVGSRKLGAWFGVSIAPWVLPLVLIGAVPAQAPALRTIGCDIASFAEVPGAACRGWCSEWASRSGARRDEPVALRGPAERGELDGRCGWSGVRGLDRGARHWQYRVCRPQRTASLSTWKEPPCSVSVPAGMPSRW